MNAADVTAADVTAADVTVIIPTRDRSALLRCALESLHAQTLAPAAVLVAEDGGITEATSRVVHEARAAGLAITHIASQGNGAASARNEALTRTNTSLVAFLDDDDLWAPTFIERVTAELSTSGVDGVVTDTRIDRGAEGAVPHRVRLGQYREALYRNVGFTGQNAIFRTDAVSAVGGFDPNLRALQDRDLQLRMLRAGSTFSALHEELVTVDQSHSMTRISTSDSRAVGYQQFCRKWRKHPPAAARLKMWRNMWIAQRHSARRYRRTVGRAMLVLHHVLAFGYRPARRVVERGRIGRQP